MQMKNMKWLVLGLTLAVAAPSAMGAALVTKGANELAIAGAVDFQSGEGTDFVLDLRYAYFVMDRFSLGTKVSLQNNDFYSHFGIGATAEYNFALPKGFKPLFGTDLVPFLGAAVDYRYSDIDHLGDESAVVLGGEGGLKFFLTDTTAVTLSLLGEIASEDVYVDDQEATNRDLRLLLGMRFYF
jgi:opacity protein-like surface antigen